MMVGTVILFGLVFALSMIGLLIMDSDLRKGFSDWMHKSYQTFMSLWRE